MTKAMDFPNSACNQNETVTYFSASEFIFKSDVTGC